MTVEKPTQRRFLACAILFLSAYLIHFTRLYEFGLWEDDYWSIAPNLDKPVDGLGALFAYHFTAWHTGRPLNHFLPTALAVIGSKAGGLPGIYTLAMVWLGFNACLVFAILRRLLPPTAALTGALTYVLFPADTTKILLVHAAHIQGAMTFLLLGTLLWMCGRGWRWVGYAVAACSLLAYETAFLPFLAAPLLFAGDRRSTWRTWVLHLALCVAFIGLIAFIRLKSGDARAAAALGSAGETFHRATTSLYLGPSTSAWSFVKGTAGGWSHLNAYAAACGLLLLGAILAFILLRNPSDNERPVEDQNEAMWPTWLDRARAPGERLPWWWIVLGGVVVWSGCYVLTLVNYPPTQLVGRFTSTHVAAAWPAALVAAALAGRIGRCGMLVNRLVLALALAVVFLLTSYHHFIQSEYIRAWREQQRFWRVVMDIAPDAGPGWTIIATGPVVPVTPVIAANSWADYHACRLIFEPTAAIPTIAFAHLGHLPFLKFEITDPVISWQPQFWLDGSIPIDPQRLILIQTDGTRGWRVPEIQTSAGVLHSLAPIPPHGRSDWPDTPVARLLFPDQYR